MERRVSLIELWPHCPIIFRRTSRRGQASESTQKRADVGEHAKEGWRRRTRKRGLALEQLEYQVEFSA